MMVRAGGGGERPRWPKTGVLRAPTSRGSWTIPRLGRTATFPLWPFGEAVMEERSAFGRRGETDRQGH